MKSEDLDWIKNLDEVGQPIVRRANEIKDRVNRLKDEMAACKAEYKELCNDIKNEWKIEDILTAKRRTKKAKTLCESEV